MPLNIDSNHNRVLLVSPDYLGLYEDVYQGLVALGYNTEAIITKTFKGDPFLLCNRNQSKKNVEEFLNELKEFWVNIYNSGKYTFYYDYLIVIGGTCLHPYLFEKLLENNPNIKKVNYLFDGIDTVYRFDRSFQYFDRIFTFDIADSKKYGLTHLPIYWVDSKNDSCIERDIFAFGSYNEIRKSVYDIIKREIPKRSFSSFIKLYLPPPIGFINKIKSFLKKILLPHRYGMVTHKSMPTQEFRRMIKTSRIIVDTSNGFQDGLSARFMWALGLGRKIITNNASALCYPFYSKEQIYIIGEDTCSLNDFIVSDFKMSDDIMAIVKNYRIDNWLNTLLFN